MRIGVSLILAFFITIAAWADEVLPLLKVGADVYSNVTVTSVTTTDIYFKSAAGIANAKLKNLEPAMQQHFHYDAAKAAAAEKKQKAANNQYSRAAAMDGGDFDPAIDRTNAQAVLDEAIQRVKVIVNQPVRSFPRPSGVHVAIYTPGWFHPGAIRPDFNNVDVRATQKLDYAQNQYVSSDANPGMAFYGAEVEFNSMTKYFYENRNLPKAKLTEKEMEEINRLYRIIGKCEALLHPRPTIAAETTDETPDAPEPKPSPFSPQGLGGA